MKKLKKPKKPVSRRTTEEKTRRTRKIFIAACVGSIVILVALLYIYSRYSAQWAESRAVKRLAADDPASCVKGIHAIARMNITEHTPELCDLFRHDSRRQVREAALNAIAVMRDPNTVPTLMYALGDSSEVTAQKALDALRNVADPQLDWHSVLQWWEENEAAFADAYRREEDTGTPVIDSLTRNLENGDKYQRADAVARLAKLKHPLAIPALTLATTDTEPIVFEPAIKALAALEE